MVLGPLCSLNSDPDSFKKLYNILPPRSENIHNIKRSIYFFIELETQGSINREFEVLHVMTLTSFVLSLL